jgi:hypothetical protein
VDDFTTEMCWSTPDKKAFVIGKLLFKQSPEDVKEITLQSKSISTTNMISDDAGAALAISADIPLQIRREGKSKKLLKPSPVVNVRN